MVSLRFSFTGLYFGTKRWLPYETPSVKSTMCDFSSFANEYENAAKKRSHPTSSKVKSEPTSSSTIKEEKDDSTEDSDEEPVTKRQRRNGRANGTTKVGSPGTKIDDDAVDEHGRRYFPKYVAPKSTIPSSRTQPTKERRARAQVDGADDDEPVKSAKTDGAQKTPVKVEVEAEDEVAEAEESAEEHDSDEEDIKPEIVAKARVKVQTTLAQKGNGKDLYPDWKAGDPVPYMALVTTFAAVEATTKRLIISAHCSLFLRQVLRLTPNDLLPTIQLMINKLAPDFAGIELGIGESLLMKAIAEATGRNLSQIKTDQHSIGDLGLVAAQSRMGQPTMFKPKALTVRGVHQGLLGIAKTSGHGAQGNKISGIKKLLSAADVNAPGGGKGVDIKKDKGGASESKFIVRCLEGKLRLGLAERTVIVALSHAMVEHEAAQKGNKVPSTEQLVEGENILKSVYSELPSYEVIIPAMLEHGLKKLKDNCKLQPGVPLKPMLAKPTKAITEVLDRFEDKTFTCEFKYDGERAQIHFVAKDSLNKYDTTALNSKGEKGVSAIFSRNSENLSVKYPDILSKLDTWVKPGTTSFVLDCESVAWDLVEKKVLPFQQLMTRKKKDVKIEDVKVKVCVFAFDLLFLNGEVSRTLCNVKTYG
jgi:DNA ligase 1